MVRMGNVISAKGNLPGRQNVYWQMAGPAIDVGTSMTYNILRPDGGFVFRSTLRSWTSNKEANPVRMAERVSFMKHLNSCINHAAKLSDLPLNDLTPDLSTMQMELKTDFRGPLMQTDPY